MPDVSTSQLPDRDACVLAALLDRQAKVRPDDVFLIFEDDDCWTFEETRRRTRRAAAGLQSLGLRRGEHLLSWQPNGKEAILAWFGANYLGAAYVPINTAFRGKLLEHSIGLSDAQILVAHPELLPRLDDIDTGPLRDVVVTSDRVPANGSETLSWHAFSRLQADVEVDAEQAIAPWDTVYIIMTSGTTGPSKAVQCTYVQAWSGAAEAMFYFSLEDRLLAGLPLFHVSGTGAVMDRLIKGGSAVVTEGFSPERFWETVDRHQITGTCLVGAMTPFLLKQPESEEDRKHALRTVITVPWNEDSLRVAKRFNLQMYTAFNMTETATPIVSGANPPELGTCGQPRPGVEARIVDANDCEVPVGETGELILRTDRPWEMSRGYYRDAAATAAAWRNGWFHTGDAFRRDEAGNHYFVDRLKDTIRRRGENISSFEVESEASACDDVREAAAIPVPSEFGEDDVMLVVAAKPDTDLDPARLFAFLEPRMAHYMLPRYIRILPELPKTPTQKIQKHLLRTQGVTNDTWDREAAGIKLRRERFQ
ncbi:MAG: AMP-binding protein [Gammaproteobacteria bacterium]|nr:AMP-binding protein [Gammaproteobacteria bacterium]